MGWGIEKHIKDEPIFILKNNGLFSFVIGFENN